MTALPVKAQLSFEEFWLSSDITVRVPLTGDTATVVANDDSIITLFPDGSGDAFVAISGLDGTDIDAYDRFPTSYSINVTREINGALIRPGDVFFASGSNAPFIFFDAEAAGIPEGINLDAITQNPDTGDLAVSFDRIFEDPTIGIVKPSDLIEVVDGQLHSLAFDGSLIPDGVNIDAAHWLTEDAMLLSFDVDVELPGGPGTLVFRDDDIVLADLVSNSFDRVLSLADDSHPSWIAADLDALWAELAPQGGEIRLLTTFREVQESAGSISVEVERINGSEGPVGIFLQGISGSATEGSDFTSDIGFTQLWADGETGVRTINAANIIDDNLQEPVEDFTVELSIFSGDAIVGTPFRATIRILDNDGQNLFSDGFES